MPATPVRALHLRVASGVDRGAALTAGERSIAVGSAETNDLVLHDPTVSRFHLEVRRRGGEIVLRDLGSTNGTRVGPVLVRSGEVVVAAGTTLGLGDTAIVIEDAERYVVQGTGPDVFGSLVGRSVALRTVTSALARVAATDIGVLLQGESGTGKELAARAIHDASARAEHPFVTVDCGAIAPTLFQSELFGHERGAFTGADRRYAGAFERAHGGTLFLDEIGELGPELQAALLGALERKRVRRVGGTEEIAVDVRLVAATHRDLRAAVNAGTFRLDLYYRLAPVSITMPPLRERPEDIPLLVERILRETGHVGPVEEVIDEATMEVFRRYDWPGNVRELRNAVLGTLALGQAPALAASERAGDVIESALDLDYATAKRAVVDEFERRWLARLLQRSGGNVRAASREGRIERKYLTELLRRHGLR